MAFVGVEKFSKIYITVLCSSNKSSLIDLVGLRYEDCSIIRPTIGLQKYEWTTWVIQNI